MMNCGCGTPKQRTIQDLDSASATTLIVDHESWIVSGGGGLCGLCEGYGFGGDCGRVGCVHPESRGPGQPVAADVPRQRCQPARAAQCGRTVGAGLWGGLAVGQVGREGG